MLLRGHVGVVMDAGCCMVLHDVCMDMVVLDDVVHGDAAGCCLRGHAVGCYGDAGAS